MITSDRRARMLLSCAVGGGDPAFAELVQNLGAEGAWAKIIGGELGEPVAQRVAAATHANSFKRSATHGSEIANSFRPAANPASTRNSSLTVTRAASRNDALILSLMRTISSRLSVRILPCHGLHPKHQREIAGTGTPIRSYAKLYSPAPTAHHASAADSSCCPGRSCTSTTTTGTAPNSEASPTQPATSELQPRKPEQSRSRRNKEPTSPYTAGNNSDLLEAQTRHPRETTHPLTAI
jgi:hypothetical protein